MGEYINFFGFGIEAGQDKSGPAISYRYAKQYFQVLNQLGVNFIDRGEVFVSPYQEKVKIRSANDIEKINWEPYEKAYKKIQNLLESRTKLVNWGGDHSVALSTVGAFVSKYPDGHVLWIDAHGDLNLPNYSPTGNLHGMPLAILMNLENIRKDCFQWITNSLNPEKLIYLGVRDLDPFEKETIKSLGITTYTISDIRSNGISSVMKEILIKTKNKPLHVSFDIDSMDPSVAPATGLHVKDGLNLDELKIIGKTLSKQKHIQSVDVVEINPLVGTSLQIEKTYLAAFILLVSILNQGGENDGISRATQALYATAMEQSSQV